MDAPGEKYVSIACNSKYKKQLILLSRISLFTTFTTRGVARIFQRGQGGGGSQRLLSRLYMVYTAALPCVSAGSVVLSRYEGPY